MSFPSWSERELCGGVTIASNIVFYSIFVLTILFDITYIALYFKIETSVYARHMLNAYE